MSGVSALEGEGFCLSEHGWSEVAGIPRYVGLPMEDNGNYLYRPRPGAGDMHLYTPYTNKIPFSSIKLTT